MSGDRIVLTALPFDHRPNGVEIQGCLGSRSGSERGRLGLCEALATAAGSQRLEVPETATPGGAAHGRQEDTPDRHSNCHRGPICATYPLAMTGGRLRHDGFHPCSSAVLTDPARTKRAGAVDDRRPIGDGRRPSGSPLQRSFGRGARCVGRRRQRTATPNLSTSGGRDAISERLGLHIRHFPRATHYVLVDSSGGGVSLCGWIDLAIAA